MSRLFNKNNSSPALPTPAADKKSPILQPKNMMVLPQPVTKSSSFKATFGERSPPQSRSQRSSLNLSQLLAPSTPAPPKSQPVFGSTLASLLAFDSAENDEQVVPFLVEECIMYLNRDDILKSEGLFRQSGKSTEVQDIKRSYDAGKYITLFNVSDPHVVTGLLKLYLRSLPDPLIPYSSYDEFIKYQKSVPKMGDVDKLRKLVDAIPLQNKILLKFLCLILRRASAFEKESKMNASSLAIVIGPNIMRSEVTDMMKAMEESPLINHITATMIETADTLFNSPELCLYDLNFFVIKRKQTPPVYPSFDEFKLKVEEKKKTRSFLSNWFSKRSKPEDLVKKKIFTDSDMASFRNSKDYTH